MLRRNAYGLCVGILILVGGLLTAGCVSDNAVDADAPLEAARYPVMQAALDSAFAELCAAIDVALAARFETDTALIPGIEWPTEMPPRRRDGASNFVDENTSWGVGYSRQIDTILYGAFWDLGRLVDTGVLIHTSPIVATHVEHDVVYNRTEGFGDAEVAWDTRIKVSLTELDTETGHLTASLQASHQVGVECSNAACDVISLTLSQGEFGKIGGDLNPTTLSGIVAGTIKLTEFDVILGYDAVFTWQVSGTIADGVATVTLSSGEFSRAGEYSLCP